MKPLNRFFLISASLLFTIQSIAAQSATELDHWASRNLEDTLKDCSHRSPREVFSKLKKLEVEYSTKADLTPLSRMKKMPEDSPFIEMGQVLFPAMLPRGYPARLVYMACHEEHQAFIESKSALESKETLAELKDCFRRSYRIEVPKTARLLLSCYQDLLSQKEL